MTRVAALPVEPIEAMRRRVLTPHAKMAIWEDADGLCGVCERPVPISQDVEWDHRIALINGGSNDLENWQPVHPNCHKLKSASDAKVAGKIRRILARLNGTRRMRAVIRSRPFQRTARRILSRGSFR